MRAYMICYVLVAASQCFGAISYRRTTDVLPQLSSDTDDRSLVGHRRPTSTALPLRPAGANATGMEPETASEGSSELGLAPEVLEKLRAGWDLATKAAGSATANWEVAAQTSELEGKLNQTIGDLQTNAPDQQVAGGDLKDVPHNKEMERLRDALKEGALPARGNAANFFNSALKLDVKLKADYASLGKSYEKQRAFRLKWAATRYENLVEERTTEEEQWDLSQVDGEYVTFSRLVQREGGDPPALECAKTFARNAVILWQKGNTFHGHPWVKWDRMRGGAVVLHYRERVQNGHSKRFRTEVKESGGPKKLRCAEASSSSAPRPAEVKTGKPEPRPAEDKDATPLPRPAEDLAAIGGTPPNPPKPAVAAAGQEPGAGLQEPKSTTPRESADKELSKRLSKALARAGLLKKELGCAVQEGADLLALVAGSSEWAWANSDCLLSGLRDYLKRIEAYKASNSFWQAWQEKENFSAYARKKFDPHFIIAEVGKADHGDGSLKSLGDKVKSETAMLKRMQATRVERD